MQVPCRVDTPEQCARLIRKQYRFFIFFPSFIIHPHISLYFLLWTSDANLKLGLGSGMLIAVPIPEKHVSAGNVIESAIQKSLEEAR